MTGDELAAESGKDAGNIEKMRDNGQTINDNLVSQAIELVDDGAAEDAVMVMRDVITITNKGETGGKCKTIGQKNYINAIKNHSVTICIGPAGTGKTYLAIAMAVDALKKRKFPELS